MPRWIRSHALHCSYLSGMPVASNSISQSGPELGDAAAAGPGEAGGGGGACAIEALSRLSESMKKFPLEATRSPSPRPSRISTRSPLRSPVVTTRGSKCPGEVSAKTYRRSPVSMTASDGTVTPAFAGSRISTVPKRPGLSVPCGFWRARRTGSVRVSESRRGYTYWIRPSNLFPG